MIEVIVWIIVGAFILEATLDRLNQNSALKEPDPLVASLYDKKGRANSIAYGTERTNLGLISGSISLALLIMALTFGWFAALDRAISGWLDSQLLVSLVASLFFAPR